MLEVAKFSAVHKLRDGRQAEIRAIRREDRDGFVEAVSRASDDRYGIDQYHCPRGGTPGTDRRGVTRKCRDL
jgi:hypothetical protein